MILYSLLIAAGLSSRMGKFKPLLPFHNDPIIISIVKKLLPFSSKVLIVTGYKEKEIRSAVEKSLPRLVVNDKIILVSNHEYEKGMFTSLRAGLRRAKDCDWILYHFVDQPQLPQNFYAGFISQIDNKYDWIQPAHSKRKGHPVLINESLFNSIVNADENSSLKEVINSKKINKKIWNCNYKEILFDMDTPEDYNMLS